MSARRSAKLGMTAAAGLPRVRAQDGHIIAIGGSAGDCLTGAAIGEYLSHRDALRAGKVGVSTWVGLLIGTVLKLAIVFAMVGLFVIALLI